MRDEIFPDEDCENDLIFKSFQISPLLSRSLEGWLRSLLDWRPATRGADFHFKFIANFFIKNQNECLLSFSEGKDVEEIVTVFTQLNTILSTKRLFYLLCVLMF